MLVFQDSGKAEGVKGWVANRRKVSVEMDGYVHRGGQHGNISVEQSMQL